MKSPVHSAFWHMLTKREQQMIRDAIVWSGAGANPIDLEAVLQKPIRHAVVIESIAAVNEAQARVLDRCSKVWGARNAIATATSMEAAHIVGDYCRLASSYVDA